MSITVPTIRQQVADMRLAAAAAPPQEVMAVFAREQAIYAAAGTPPGVAEIGTQLADVDLLDTHGAPTTLYAGLGDGPSVLVLYRGSWCPYCNLTLRTYQATLRPALVARGIRLIALSPQLPDGSLSMQEKQDLTFTVLSDPGNQVAAQLGVLTAPSKEVRATQVALGLDLEAVNADGTTTILMPTTVVLDGDHRLRWIDVHPDYTTRSESAEVLAALDAAGL
jgi:peroxiredoxin